MYGLAQRLQRRARDRKVVGSSPRQERRGNFLLQGQLSVLTVISVSDPPRDIAVARERYRSFCQKCGRQVTATRMHPTNVALNEVT